MLFEIYRIHIQLKLKKTFMGNKDSVATEIFALINGDLGLQMPKQPDVALWFQGDKTVHLESIGRQNGL